MRAALPPAARAGQVPAGHRDYLLPASFAFELILESANEAD